MHGLPIRTVLLGRVKTRHGTNQLVNLSDVMVKITIHVRVLGHMVARVGPHLIVVVHPIMSVMVDTAMAHHVLRVRVVQTVHQQVGLHCVQGMNPELKNHVRVVAHVPAVQNTVVRRDIMGRQQTVHRDALSVQHGLGCIQILAEL